LILFFIAAHTDVILVDACVDYSLFIINLYLFEPNMYLSDVLFVIIYNKFNQFDVLYLFVIGKKRPERLAEVTYTRSVKLIKANTKNENYSFLDFLLNRFCFEILSLFKFDQALAWPYFTSKKIICFLIQQFDYSVIL
jgi:hypothetical protein